MRLLLMLVVAVLVVCVLLLLSIFHLQQFQHLPHDDLKGSAEVLAAVGFS